jgi:hypothetical protein
MCVSTLIVTGLQQTALAQGNIQVQTVTVKSASPTAFIVKRDVRINVGPLEKREFKVRAFRGSKAELPTKGPIENGCRKYDTTVYERPAFVYQYGELVLPATSHAWLDGDPLVTTKWVFVLESGGPSDGVIRISADSAQDYFKAGIEVEIRPDQYNRDIVLIEQRDERAAYEQRVRNVSVERGCLTLRRAGASTYATFDDCTAGHTLLGEPDTFPEFQPCSWFKKALSKIVTTLRSP